ncbi:MAG TPA: hypothetical protein VG673_07745 [Actinomycetota bacterium]|nr:hypothetical protein [Actinomycetota bacterium]
MARAAPSPSTWTAIGFGYEYTDVGRDALSPVTDEYPSGDTAFTGPSN